MHHACLLIINIITCIKNKGEIYKLSINFYNAFIFNFQCSVSCGRDGVQNRRVLCQLLNGHVLSDGQCNMTVRPSHKQLCNNGPCSTKRRWRISQWTSVRYRSWYYKYYQYLQRQQRINRMQRRINRRQRRRRRRRRRRRY